MTLGWDGGLNTSLHEAYIGMSELSDGSNFIVRDGTARLDTRYIKWLERQAGDETPRGSGWGKYSTGSQSEQYVVVLGTAMYYVDLTAAAAVTAVAGATGLTASDWWFAQFADYMYAGNATDGLGRKKLAAGSNGTGDWARIQLPTAPAAAPTSAPDFTYAYQSDFTGSTIANSGLTSATLVDGQLECVCTTGGRKTVTVTLDTSPDLRINAQYRDTFETGFSVNAALNISNLALKVLEGANEYYCTHWTGNLGGNWGNPQFRMQNIARSNRDQVTAIKFEFDAPPAGCTVTFTPPFFRGVWLPLDSSTNPGNANPTLPELKYATTNYNSTTGFESAPSAILTVPAAAQGLGGEWRTITGASSAESGVDFVRFYRVVTENGVTTYYRLDTVSDASTPTYTDKLPLDEVKALATYSPSILPNSGITGICAWQNRLVLAAGTLVYISKDGQPLAYEPQSGAYDLYNPARGLTFYPDDKRGEDIIAVVGQDDLYMVSKYSVRCLVGNSPDNWRLIKLPDSEGACGPRAVCAYKKGILVLTPSGKLLYHHSSLLEPQLVSHKVHPRIGNEGIKALATSGAVVTVWPDGEIAVYSTTSYMIMDIEGRWRKGTLTHGVHSALSVPNLSEKWIGSNGKFYEGGVDTYVSDGGSSGTNGTAVTFNLTTRKFLNQRMAITNVFWGDSTESPTSGTPTLPKVDIITDRGTLTYTKRDAKYNTNVKVTNNGYGMKFKVYGDKDTVIETVRMEYREMGQSRQK
jgi:hypothetical protein